MNRFEAHADTRAILEIFMALEPGETATFANIKTKINRPIRGSDSHLQSARKMAMTRGNIVLQNIPNVGYWRLSSEEIAASLPNDTKSINRRFLRQIDKASCAVFDELSKAAQMTLMTHQTIAAMGSQVTGKPIQVRIEGAITVGEKRLSIEETIKLFDGER